MYFCFTFGADVSARDAHLDAVVLHLHLVAGTGSHAGVVVDHKIIWKKNQVKLQSVNISRSVQRTGTHSAGQVTAGDRGSHGRTFKVFRVPITSYYSINKFSGYQVPSKSF